MMGVRTREEFDKVDKYVLKDPKKASDYNQYKESAKEVAKRNTKNLFKKDPKYKQLLSQNDSWMQGQIQKVFQKANPSLYQAMKAKDDFFKERLTRKREIDKGRQLNL